MSDTPPRTVRTVLVADPVWETLSQMAREMGADRDSLVNQAIFTFARLNGYVTPGRISHPAHRSLRGSAPADTDDDMAGPSPASLREEDTPDGLRAIRHGHASADDAGWDAGEGGPDDFAHHASPDRSAIDGDLGHPADPNDRSDPNAIDRLLGDSAPPPVAEPSGPALVLYSDAGEELERVRTDRFLIGRGKHCDLIIHSGKVSREHAAIVLEDGAFFIEDLGSSNGTWHDRKRITRRRVEDGDEYFICSEKITCRFV